MMFACFLLGAVMLVIGVVLALKAVGGVTIVGRLLRRPTLAVARLHEGPVEVSGKVSAIGDALTSLSGHRCVAVKTTVSGSTGGEDGTSTGSKTVQRVVPSRLADATGACRLDLDLSELVGERWVSRTVEQAELAHVSWSDLVPPGSLEVSIEEWIIPEGTTVLVSGDATEAPREPGYREGSASEWVLSGTAEHLLVVALGGQTGLLARTVGIAALVFAVGVYLGALGILMIGVVLTG